MKGDMAPFSTEGDSRRRRRRRGTMLFPQTAELILLPRYVCVCLSL